MGGAVASCAENFEKCEPVCGGDCTTLRVAAKSALGPPREVRDVIPTPSGSAGRPPLLTPGASRASRLMLPQTPVAIVASPAAASPSGTPGSPTRKLRTAVMRTLSDLHKLRKVMQPLYTTPEEGFMAFAGGEEYISRTRFLEHSEHIGFNGDTERLFDLLCGGDGRISCEDFKQRLVIVGKKAQQKPGKKFTESVKLAALAAGLRPSDAVKAAVAAEHALGRSRSQQSLGGLTAAQKNDRDKSKISKKRRAASVSGPMLLEEGQRQPLLSKARSAEEMQTSSDEVSEGLLQPSEQAEDCSGIADGVARPARAYRQLPSKAELGVYITTEITSIGPKADAPKPEIAELAGSSRVNVVEAVFLPDLYRVRGRIDYPPGWITLLNTKTGRRFAVKSHEPSTNVN